MTEAFYEQNMTALKTLDTNQGYSRGILETPTQEKSSSVFRATFAQEEPASAPIESGFSISSFAQEFTYTTDIGKAVEQATSTLLSEALTKGVESGRISEGIFNVKKARAGKRIK